MLEHKMQELKGTAPASNCYRTACYLLGVRPDITGKINREDMLAILATRFRKIRKSNRGTLIAFFAKPKQSKRRILFHTAVSLGGNLMFHQQRTGAIINHSTVAHYIHSLGQGDIGYGLCTWTKHYYELK